MVHSSKFTHSTELKVLQEVFKDSKVSKVGSKCSFRNSQISSTSELNKKEGSALKKKNMKVRLECDIQHLHE